MPKIRKSEINITVCLKTTRKQKIKLWKKLFDYES